MDTAESAYCAVCARSGNRGYVGPSLGRGGGLGTTIVRPAQPPCAAPAFSPQTHPESRVLRLHHSSTQSATCLQRTVPQLVSALPVSLSYYFELSSLFLL